MFNFVKLRRATILHLLRYHITLDVGITLLTLRVHRGSFSGIMAATFAGMLTSVGTSTAKHLFCYILGRLYYPGIVRLDV